MGKTTSSKKILKLITIVLVAIFVVTGVLLGLEMWDLHRGKFNGENQGDKPVIYNGVEYELNKNIQTFLVLGLDKFEGASSTDSYNNDKQSDFLMLFIFDDSAKKWSVMNINRDTMVEMNILGVAGDKVGTVTKQIALAHTYGNGRNVSCQNTADAVSNLLNGVRVNHYISLTMDSVSVLNDLVGGVEVTVLDDFTGIDDKLIKGQNVTLKGAQALTYVRTRYGLEDSTNSTRMERQKQYLDGLYEKIVSSSEKDEEFIVNASLKMTDYIISDRSVTQLQELGKKCIEYTKGDIITLAGESKMGEKYVEFYPDSAALEKLVIDLFYLPKS